MPVSISGTNGVTFPDSSLQAAAASPNTLKNRLINGDFRIDQRNAGASVTPAADFVYTLDRWRTRSFTGAASKYSVQQNAAAVTPPTGFSNYLGVTSLSAYSVGASDYYAIEQAIEGFNFADLGFGSANAKTITLSFWVRSSLTGTFGGSIRNDTSNYCYPFSYTISTANTWEQKTITITGATAGTWVGATNGNGAFVAFNLGAGSTYTGTANTWYASTTLNPTGATSVVGTNGATFYITGVQLEQNTSATPFERRLYGQELANCQRYYWKMSDANAPVAVGTVYFNSSYARTYTKHPVTMRAAPTLSIVSTLKYSAGGTDTGVVSSINNRLPGVDSSLIEWVLTTASTLGYGIIINCNAGYLQGDAEL
jgi:hypothetical protein